jgi:non-ribosomal peptide synthetase component E (peptide arylation enzyme)
MLHAEVCKFANVLKSLGIGKGDVVAMYMPMIPELPIAMLACARIGAIHSVVFGGFSGEAIAVFVTLTGGFRPSEQLRQELKDHVRREIGALAVPDEIRFTDALPKTRSGKIMRRLLRDVAAGRQTAGDTTTLQDFSVLPPACGAGRSNAKNSHGNTESTDFSPQRTRRYTEEGGNEERETYTLFSFSSSVPSVSPW